MNERNLSDNSCECNTGFYDKETSIGVYECLKCHKRYTACTEIDNGSIC